MAVLLETSKGDMVIDLHVDACPRTCKNFLKLCKIKYYNDVLFHTVTKDFVVQTGDPTGTGKGGDSVYGKLYGDQARFFEDEIRATLKHGAKGTVSMASGGGENRNASQFLITARADCDALDGKHTVFGVVAEGLDVLDAINEAYCDDRGRPWQNIRIKHTVVLDDPFEDPPGLAALIPDASPTFARDPNDTRLEDDWVPQDAEGANADPAAIERQTREKEARNRAVVLEMIGDLPEADAKPPEESLFVCKLNPVTGDEDLEIIFSRFGRVVSCDVVRDHKTGDSLCFAFVTFETREAAETAYLKMDNVLIDDRRVRVDFSQSMHGLWRNFKKFGAKGGTAEDRNAADNARRGPTRGGRDRGVDKTFRAGDGRSTFEIKGSAMGHIGGGGRAPAPRPPEDRAPREGREDDRRRARAAEAATATATGRPAASAAGAATGAGAATEAASATAIGRRRRNAGATATAAAAATGTATGRRRRSTGATGADREVATRGATRGMTRGATGAGAGTGTGRGAGTEAGKGNETANDAAEAATRRATPRA